MTQQDQGTTKELILDTAERLFAERGLDGTSVRDITGAARVNLGAITYHFATKEKLITAMFNRRFGPFVRWTLELLDEEERKAGRKPPTMEALLEAMMRPMVEGSFCAGKKNIPFMRLMGRCQSEPNPKIERLVRSHMQAVFSRFAAAAHRVVPDLSSEELFWRIQFTMGALHRALLVSSKEDLQKVGKKLDAEGLLKQLVAFAAAGMKAPRTRFR
jgi:AcrR family transcriptional regulator